MTNIGNRPTFGADSFAVESHLLDFRPIELEEHTPLRLLFHRRLREERRWPSPEALKEQIMRDVGQAKRYLHLMRLLGRETNRSSSEWGTADLSSTLRSGFAATLHRTQPRVRASMCRKAA